MTTKTRAETVCDALSLLLQDGPVNIAGVDVVSCDLSADKSTIHIRSRVGNFEDDFVITNPPLLVPDSNGTVRLRGRMYREDPVAAVTDTIRLYAETKNERVTSA